MFEQSEYIRFTCADKYFLCQYKKNLPVIDDKNNQGY
jgi:hypothetical protein